MVPGIYIDCFHLSLSLLVFCPQLPKLKYRAISSHATETCCVFGPLPYKNDTNCHFIAICTIIATVINSYLLTPTHHLCALLFPSKPILNIPMLFTLSLCGNVLPHCTLPVHQHTLCIHEDAPWSGKGSLSDYMLCTEYGWCDNKVYLPQFT